MRYNIQTDLHTHTIVSGHAYSTLEENIRAAADRGLRAIAVTEHGPSMEGAPSGIHFMNYRILPREHLGVRILRGVELNILNYDGDVDLPSGSLKKLDFVLASFHEIITPPGSSEENTRAWLNVIRNPLIDCLGHPGRGPYPYDLDCVIEACAEHDKAVEVNNHSLRNLMTRERCAMIIERCKAYNVYVAVNSDAHFQQQSGMWAVCLSCWKSSIFRKNL